MPPYYDIYALSKQREKATIEKFLAHFSYREKIENPKGQEIAICKNEKYNTEDTWIPVSTLSEVIDFGLMNKNLGFAFYISDHLKEGIKTIILKFTFDGKIIFGISVEEKIIVSDNLIDNYPQALELEKQMIQLTNTSKSSIQFEYAPSDVKNNLMLTVNSGKDERTENAGNGSLKSGYTNVN